MLTQILEIPPKSFAKVASGLFAYLFGLIDKRAFYEYVGDRELARKAVNNARSSEHAGYVLKNCKLFAYAAYKARLQGLTIRAKDFDVTQRDASFLRRLNLRDHSYHALSITQYDKLVAQSLMTPDMRAYVGRLISKKLIFLVHSYGVSREDLESSLTSAALYALYKQYPKYESALHAKNICKTTIHNTAMNLIQHHTRGKRQALQRSVGGGFEAVHVPLDAVFDLAAPVEHDYKEALVSLVSLQDRMTPRVQQFIQCAAGKYHEGLSTFLGIANDEAVESMQYDTYLSRLRSYFNVSEAQTQVLFAKLRPYIT